MAEECISCRKYVAEDNFGWEMHFVTKIRPGNPKADEKGQS